MVLHKGDKQYRLAGNFFKQKDMSKKLAMSKEMPDFAALLYDAIKRELSRVHGVKLVASIPTKATVERVKELEKKLADEEKANNDTETLFKEFRHRSRKRKRDRLVAKCKACKTGYCNQRHRREVDSDCEEYSSYFHGDGDSDEERNPDEDNNL